MDAKRCDRCGAFFSPMEDSKGSRWEDEWWRYYIGKDNHPYGTTELDLCLNCRKELYRWIKNA